MGVVQKAVILTCLLLLAACGGGEQKVTRIDGTSKGTAERTYKKLVYQVKDQGQQIQWDLDYKMLVHYYPDGDDLIKHLGGKTLQDLNPEIVEAHAFYLKKHRALMVSEEQKQLDIEQAKVDEWQGMPDSHTKPVMISQHEARVRMYTKSRDEILALTDAQFIKIYGDGASFSDYVRPGGTY